MAVKPSNYGNGWSDEDIGLLKTLAAEKWPLTLISKKLARTERSVKSKATEVGVALKAARRLQNSPK
jgi:hypothetical protein